MTQFEISSGNLHDVAGAKNVLKKYQGIVIGDKGYCSKPLKKQLQKQGLRLVARHKKTCP
ncbi:MAG: transposase [Puniceicoccales bacterium]|nr:transposase [Puniceicoccales bacterium]